MLCNTRSDGSVRRGCQFFASFTRCSLVHSPANLRAEVKWNFNEFGIVSRWVERFWLAACDACFGESCRAGQVPLRSNRNLLLFHILQNAFHLTSFSHFTSFVFVEMLMRLSRPNPGEHITIWDLNKYGMYMNSSNLLLAATFHLNSR